MKDLTAYCYQFLLQKFVSVTNTQSSKIQQNFTAPGFRKTGTYMKTLHRHTMAWAKIL